MNDLNERTVKQIRKLAKKYKWIEEKQSNKYVLRFRREFNEVVDVYHTKMTVGTLVHHPKGRKMLFRRHVGKEMLEQIFKKPRVHTGIGYSRK